MIWLTIINARNRTLLLNTWKAFSNIAIASIWIFNRISVSYFLAFASDNNNNNNDTQQQQQQKMPFLPQIALNFTLAHVVKLHTIYYRCQMIHFAFTGSHRMCGSGMFMCPKTMHLVHFRLQYKYFHFISPSRILFHQKEVRTKHFTLDLWVHAVFICHTLGKMIVQFHAFVGNIFLNHKFKSNRVKLNNSNPNGNIYRNLFSFSNIKMCLVKCTPCIYDCICIWA